MYIGPTDPAFEMFKKKFGFIPLHHFHLWEWPDDFPSQPFTFLVNRALQVREWGEHHLLNGTFGRDDYRELCELMVQYLGGQVNHGHFRN